MARKTRRRTRRQIQEAAPKAAGNVRKQTPLDETARDYLSMAASSCKKRPVTMAMGYVWDDGRLWLGGRAVEID